jgi:hypothetical protein
MVQGAGQPGLLLKAGEESTVRVECLPDDLDRDIALQAGVAGTVNLGHATRSEEGDHLVGSHSGSRGQAHGRTVLPPGVRRFGDARAAR